MALDRTPYLLKARLYGFDGSAFHTLWTSPEFSTYEISHALRETPTGFSIQRFNTENPANWRLVEDSYILTPNGAEKAGSAEIAQ